MPKPPITAHRIALLDFRKLGQSWLKHPKEPVNFFEMFQSWLQRPREGRDYQFLCRKYNVKMSWVQELAGRYKWASRAQDYDSQIAEKVAERVTDFNVDYLARAQQSTEKLVATLADEALRAIENDDDASYERALKRLKPFLHMVVGDSNLGNFLLKAHETFHGTKHVEERNIKSLSWGTNVSSVIPEKSSPSATEVSFGKLST